MNTIPKCSKCRFYAHDHHLVCVPQPTGSESLTCLDIEPNPTLEGRHFVDFLGLQRQQINAQQSADLDARAAALLKRAQAF